MGKITTHTIQSKKQKGEKITMSTAYDFPTAKIIDESGMDMILIGDSVGNTVLGYDNTLKVTMEDMIHHTKAVSRAVKNAMVVADMPFLSYHTGISEAVKNAGRLMQEANADCVKLEGGAKVADKIKAFVDAGIPVVGHLGLTPQSVNVFGGFFVQGKTDLQKENILKDTMALVEAGVFAIVLECIPADFAKTITEKIPVPTIGIGAGVHCDGQVLVLHDMIGLSGAISPKFAKRYCDVGGAIKGAVEQYITEVKNGAFPDEEHSFITKEK